MTHSYPSRYPPGIDPDLDTAWSILDRIKEGIIPDEVRAFLAGMITEALKQRKNKKDEKENAPSDLLGPG